MVVNVIPGAGNKTRESGDCCPDSSGNNLAHRFRDNEILLQTVNDFNVISPPEGALCVVDIIVFPKGDPDFVIVFAIRLLLFQSV